MSDSPPLRKIAEVVLAGRTLAVGKNGRYVLVDETERDAWGNPVGRVIELTVDDAQPLLDVLGEYIEKVQAMKLERDRRMGGGAE